MGLYLNESGVLTPIAGRGDLTAIRSEMSYLGAKNLFDGSVDTTSAKGVTFTQNTDGTISVTGSNTQGSGIGIFAKKIQRLKAGSYILNGCPSPTSGGLHIQLSDSDLNVLIAETYDGNETSFTLNADTNCKIMYWGSGDLVITGTLTISTMIRLASDPDNTYQPYAKTNQELTKATEDTGWITVDSTNITNMASGTIKYRVKNGYCTISVANVLPTDATKHIDIVNIPKSKAIVGASLSHGGNYQTDGWINANTTFRINANSNNTSGRYGSLTYPID